MRHELEREPIAAPESVSTSPPTTAPGPLDDLLTGEGSLNFVEGDTQVRVGWLRAGGDGLIVTARVDEGVIGQTRFWCDAQQWCDWLAADLPVPSWDDLPPAWHANAASLTLVTQGAGEEADGEMPRDGASEHAFREAWPGTGDATSWPSATVLLRERVETAWRVGMVLQRAGRQLALMYLDGASAWLRERCRRATPGDTPLDPAGWPERRCALVAGWVTLPATQGHDLHAGDAVLLDVAADIERGEYWLVDGEFAVAMCDGRPSDRHVVQFGDADRQGGEMGAVRWYAVVAERLFPIPLLMAWRAGVPAISHRSAAHALHAVRITLRCDRSASAGGRLLRFGDGRLAVQIDAESDAPPPCNGTAGDAPPNDISGRDPMGLPPAAT